MEPEQQEHLSQTSTESSSSDITQEWYHQQQHQTTHPYSSLAQENLQQVDQQHTTQTCCQKLNDLELSSCGTKPSTYQNKSQHTTQNIHESNWYKKNSTSKEPDYQSSSKIQHPWEYFQGTKSLWQYAPESSQEDQHQISQQMYGSATSTTDEDSISSGDCDSDWDCDY
nr:hypothetical protein [Cressdnaviricota sp.]